MKIKEVKEWRNNMSIEEEAGLYYYYWTSLAKQYQKLEEKYDLLYDLRNEEVKLNNIVKEIKIEAKKLKSERDRDVFKQKLIDIKKIVSLCNSECSKEILEIIGDINE